ncbi:hypothetical protein CR513_11511, partial [Mucuna pruriens]
MRLNPDKCVFRVKGEKFLGFMLTHRGIEANPDKCEAITKMKSPQNMKEMQRLIVFEHAINVAVVQEQGKKRNFVYCISKMVSVPKEDPWWILYVDGLSNPQGGGASIILEGLRQAVLEHFLKLDFKTSNNQVEYETLLAGLDLALDVGV